MQFVPVDSGGLVQILLAVLPSEAVQPFEILVTASVGGRPGISLGVGGVLMTPLADGSDFVFRAQPIVVPGQGAQLIVHDSSRFLVVGIGASHRLHCHWVRPVLVVPRPGNSVSSCFLRRAGIYWTLLAPPR